MVEDTRTDVLIQAFRVYLLTTEHGFSSLLFIYYACVHVLTCSTLTFISTAVEPDALGLLRDCLLTIQENQAIMMECLFKPAPVAPVAPVLPPSTAAGPSHTNPAVSSSSSVLELNADELLEYMERSSRQGEGSARLTVSPSPTPSCLIQTPLNQFSPPQTPIRRITSPLSHFTPSPSPQPEPLPRLSSLTPRYRPLPRLSPLPPSQHKPRCHP